MNRFFFHERDQQFYFAIAGCYKHLYNYFLLTSEKVLSFLSAGPTLSVWGEMWLVGAGAPARHEVTLEEAEETRGLGWHSTVAAGRDRT